MKRFIKITGVSGFPLVLPIEDITAIYVSGEKTKVETISKNKSKITWTVSTTVSGVLKEIEEAQKGDK